MGTQTPSFTGRRNARTAGHDLAGAGGWFGGFWSLFDQLLGSILGAEHSQTHGKMIKVHIYKLKVDSGGAPCSSKGILSLPICKPAICPTAKRGDIILGFAADHLYSDNPFVYVARVTKELDGRKYFSKSQYAARPDGTFKPFNKIHCRGRLLHCRKFVVFKEEDANAGGTERKRQSVHPISKMKDGELF